jgi:hypothetical protein
MIHPYELKAEDMRAFTIRTVQKYLPIDANGYSCKTDMILDVLVKSSAENSDREATGAELRQIADSDAVREYVKVAGEAAAPAGRTDQCSPG